MSSIQLNSLNHSKQPFWLGLIVGSIVLLICLIYSITLGARDIPLRIILESFTAFDRSFDHLVIQTVRLLRSLMAITVGAALAVSGALMQGLTRNPLAETGILGIESGGALAVVANLFLFGSSSVTVYGLKQRKLRFRAI